MAIPRGISRHSPVGVHQVPIYVYECPTCKTRSQVFKRISAIDSVEKCYDCSSVMARQVTAPAVVSDYAGYSCPITGDWVEGRKAHANNLAKHGCRLYEPGETEATQRRKAREEADFDNRIADTAEQLVHEMPAAKREQLISEIQAGATIEVSRPNIN
jgi:putative FmdB family regulatory protein